MGGRPVHTEGRLSAVLSHQINVRAPGLDVDKLRVCSVRRPAPCTLRPRQSARKTLPRRMIIGEGKSPDLVNANVQGAAYLVVARSFALYMAGPYAVRCCQIFRCERIALTIKAHPKPQSVRGQFLYKASCKGTGAAIKV